MRAVLDLMYRAQAAVLARQRDERGDVVEKAVTVAGFVAAALLLVGLATGFVQNQLSALGG
ncbi:MAG TPA: hypothetical protein VFC13_10030 [Actinomycetes bacterium]|nr:hypothetical protein [Actinomycetes bacterium]